mmetsp:Transcript_165848/g.532507  ORF Transcript_165848/g.532507 Transcript_165848/m.532507 type:complete len:273 (-) Transcript_165848:700-1518(-)
MPARKPTPDALRTPSRTSSIAQAHLKDDGSDAKCAALALPMPQIRMQRQVHRQGLPPRLMSMRDLQLHASSLRSNSCKDTLGIKPPLMRGCEEDVKDEGVSLSGAPSFMELLPIELLALTQRSASSTISAEDKSVVTAKLQSAGMLPKVLPKPKPAASAAASAAEGRTSAASVVATSSARSSSESDTFGAGVRGGGCDEAGCAAAVGTVVVGGAVRRAPRADTMPPTPMLPLRMLLVGRCSNIAFSLLALPLPGPLSRRCAGNGDASNWPPV